MAFKNIGIGGIIAIGIGAIAILSNPGEQQYLQYADTTLKTKVKDKVCAQVSQDLGVWLEGQCHLLINTASPYIAEVIVQQTRRDNFLLFKHLPNRSSSASSPIKLSPRNYWRIW